MLFDYFSVFIVQPGYFSYPRISFLGRKKKCCILYTVRTSYFILLYVYLVLHIVYPTCTKYCILYAYVVLYNLTCCTYLFVQVIIYLISFLLRSPFISPLSWVGPHTPAFALNYVGALGLLDASCPSHHPQRLLATIKFIDSDIV